MKLFAQGMLARKKIVLIFFLAILLPALVVGTMSLGAFSKRRAAQAYRESSARSPSDREKAMALEAMGRCLISVGNLNEAYRVYGELGEKYGRIQDQAVIFWGTFPKVPPFYSVSIQGAAHSAKQVRPARAKVLK